MKFVRLVLLMMVATTVTLSSHAVALEFDDAIGTVFPGIPPSDPKVDLYITTLLGLDTVTPYSNTGSKAGAEKIGDQEYIRFKPGFEDIVVTEPKLKKVEGGNNSVTGIVGPYFLYGKYGGGKDDGGAFVWYVAGGDVTIPLNGNPYYENDNDQGYALSHWSAWRAPEQTNVPDGGSTVALLGLALAGLGVLRRQISSK